MTLVNAIVALLLGLAGMWWLSGWDARVTGEHPPSDIIRRVIRCLVSLVLIWIFFVVAGLGLGTIPLIMTVPVLLGLLWCGPIAELASHGFRKLMGVSSDDHHVDPNEGHRQMEVLAGLIRDGQHDEAAQLAKQLQASSEANPMVLETLLGRANIPYDRSRESDPLKQARYLRSQGKNREAETVLRSMLAARPSNLEAAMILIRLYVQDLSQPDQAMEVLEDLKKQPDMPREAIDYAHRSIEEWGRKKVEPAAMLPETVDELLADGYLGTAIEILEDRAAGRPDDFEAQLKLAEAYGLYSRDLSRAKKIVAAMERKTCFSEDQVRAAKDKLAEWRDAPRPNDKKSV